MKVRRRKLEELTPYARNPRRIDTGAVAAVAASLTALAALELGLTTAPVVTISAEHAAAYRLVDNRTGELSRWDTELLVGEIEPGYVDVAVDRWQQLTGKKARRRAA